MKNFARDYDTESFDEQDDYESFERFGSKPRFRKEKRYDNKERDVSIRDKRLAKEREREQLIKDSEDGNL